MAEKHLPLPHQLETVRIYHLVNIGSNLCLRVWEGDARAYRKEKSFFLDFYSDNRGHVKRPQHLRVFSRISNLKGADEEEELLTMQDLLLRTHSEDLSKVNEDFEVDSFIASPGTYITVKNSANGRQWTVLLEGEKLLVPDEVHSTS